MTSDDTGTGTAACKTGITIELQQSHIQRVVMRDHYRVDLLF